MAYSDNPGPSGAEPSYGSDMEQVSPMAPPEGEQMGKQIVELPPGWLPEGFDPKPGEVIEARVESVDGGKVTLSYNTGEEPKEEAHEEPGEGQGTDSWERDFLQGMSPRSSGNDMPA